MEAVRRHPSYNRLTADSMSINCRPDLPPAKVTRRFIASWFDYAYQPSRYMNSDSQTMSCYDAMS